MQRLLRVLLVGAVAFAVFLPAGAARADHSPEHVEEELEKAHSEVELVIEEFNGIGEQLKATQAAVAALAEKLAPLEAKLDAARSGVSKLAATAYKNGGELAVAGFVFSGGSNRTVVHQMESMERVARSRQREITAYTDARKLYDAEKKRLDDLLKAQTQQQQQLTERRTKIEAEIKRLEEKERRLGGGRPAQPGVKPPPPPSGSGKGAIAVRFAYAQLGKMYRYGAAGPTNFDCSGLTQMAWKSAGVNLPHNAAMQWRSTARVSNPVPGDLVYYGLGHVGIYIGNEQQIHASRTGRPVAVATVDRRRVTGFTRPG